MFSREQRLAQIAALGLILVLSLAVKSGEVYYVLRVDQDATGSNNGTSWTDAYTHLQDALDHANSDPSNNYQIWVAEGVYYPDEESIGSEHTDNDQWESFRLNYDNVKLLGGFNGTESDPAKRDWLYNPTILSGDIDGNDANGDGNYIAEDWNDISGNNAYHVIFLNGVTNEEITLDTVIDGFTITGGDGTISTTYGGGIYCGSYSSSVESGCSPALRNLVIQGNQAYFGGGFVSYIINLSLSNPEFTNIKFFGNRATQNGGGMYMSAISDPYGQINPRLVNVEFRGNQAGANGGGLGFYVSHGHADATLSNVVFYDNHAENYGGGIYASIGDDSYADQYLTNVTLHGNSADKGGGAYYHRALTSGAYFVYFRNTIIWGNTATTGDPEFHNVNTTSLIYHCDIQGSGGSAGWLSYYGVDKGGNIDADPLFVDPAAGRLSLTSNSPALDAGDQTLLPADVTDVDGDGNFAETLPDDLRFNPRVEGGEVDLGAYEYKPSGVGFFVPGNYRWYLKSDRSDGWSGVTSFGWGGVSELQPVVGDWFGNGMDTAGFYKPSQYKWFFKDDYLDGWGIIYYLLWGGSEELVPITGDWDGDGVDTMGFYKYSDCEWYLKNDFSFGWSGITTLSFCGASENIPITGDWDGDGDDTIGFFVPSQNRWYLKNDLEDGWSSVTSFTFGTADPMEPVAGDWDGDGIDTVGGYVPSRWRWFLKDDQISGWSNVSIIRFGVTADFEVISGDWQ